MLGLLKTGKEAEVFVVERRTLDGARTAVLAHKRYRPLSVVKGQLEAEGFSRARTFTDGRYRAGEGSATAGTPGRWPADRRTAAGSWPSGGRATSGTPCCGRTRQGVTVPYPVEQTADGILMQFLGDAGTGAPRLVSARLSAPELSAAHDQLMEDLARLTRAGLVHADLSPYNVLWWRGRAWIIDLPQAVDLVTNPGGLDLLHHDVTTVCRWFAPPGGGL